MKPEELRLYIERELDAIFTLTEMAKVPSLSDALLDAKSKLNEHLKLAIVGKTKAGKSTLLNALLRIKELPTGDTITTGNVSVLLHIDKSPAKKEMAVIHLEDGKELYLTLKQYKELVDIRKPDSLGIRNQVVWFDVYLNHPILKDMSIIDTPGDDSWLKNDSENTKALFRDANRKPDIVVFVVRKEFGCQDIQSAQEYLAQINGAKHRVSGLNVIAVYSCCDELVASNNNGCDWNKDYRIEGNRIIENNRKKSSAFRTCFSKCFPIAGLFAMVAYSITVKDFSILRTLSETEEAENFYRDISFIEYSMMNRMYPSMYAVFGNNFVKQDMISRLGLGTMKYIVWWCKTHPDQPFESLQRDLEVYSNVPALRSYLLDEHYKKLSLFYKITSVLPELKKSVEKSLNMSIDTDTRTILRKTLERCLNIEKGIYSQYGFLSVMRDYYDCCDYFDSEDWNQAEQTMAFLLSDSQDNNVRLELKKQWHEKMDFYKCIGNHFAIDASEKLIESLSSNYE